MFVRVLRNHIEENIEENIINLNLQILPKNLASGIPCTERDHV